MAVRSVSQLAFFAAFILPISAQDNLSFPPSKPYRAQLSERGPIQELALREAIAMALTQNPEIAIEDYGASLARASTANARSFYDPQAGLNLNLLSSNLPVTSILQTGESDSQITHSWSVSPGISQNLPGGGTAALSVNLTRVSTNGLYVFINPVYTSTAGLTITQPLLRGFLRTAQEKQIVISRLNERMSESQFEQKVSHIAEEATGAYWRLAVAIDYYEVQRQARDVAVLEFEEARKREREGQDSPISVTAKRSDVLSREQSLTQAAVSIAQASNNLKRLMAKNVFDALWGVGLVTSDRPEPKESTVGMEEAVKTALDRRPELEQLRLQIRQSGAEVRFAKQEAKPAVNLRLEMQSTGAAGTVYALGSDLLASQTVDPSNPAYGALGKSYEQSLKLQHPSIAAGIEVKFPLRNRAATSQLTSAEIAARKLELQLRATEEDILVEVRNAWEAIAAQRRNVEAASIARRLAEERLAAEPAKTGGSSPNLDLMRDQRDLADAQVHELQALIDYQMSEVSLEKSMNTLVDDQQNVLAHRK